MSIVNGFKINRFSLNFLIELKHWLYVLLLREFKNKNSGGSLVLIESSLFRAEFCELLAKRNFLKNASEYFLLGMFSLMDIIFHRPMLELLNEVPLTDDVSETLIGMKTIETIFRFSNCM